MVIIIADIVVISPIIADYIRPERAAPPGTTLSFDISFTVIGNFVLIIDFASLSTLYLSYGRLVMN